MKNGLLMGWLAVLITLGACQGPEKVAYGNGEAHHQAARSAEAADTVVDRHGELTNEKRFAEFLANLEEEKADQIRITSYTTEGDPIYRDLAFDGSQIKMVVDTTKDQYGSGEVTETICTAIKEVKAAEQTDYVLKNCAGATGDPVVLVKWEKG